MPATVFLGVGVTLRLGRSLCVCVAIEGEAIRASETDPDGAEGHFPLGR